MGNEVDVDDCFYNFTIESLASWFGFDEPCTAGQLRKCGFDVDRVFDDRTFQYYRLADDQILFPVMKLCAWDGVGFFTSLNKLSRKWYVVLSIYPRLN